MPCYKRKVAVLDNGQDYFMHFSVSKEPDGKVFIGGTGYWQIIYPDLRVTCKGSGESIDELYDITIKDDCRYSTPKKLSEEERIKICNDYYEKCRSQASYQTTQETVEAALRGEICYIGPSGNNTNFPDAILC